MLNWSAEFNMWMLTTITSLFLWIFTTSGVQMKKQMIMSKMSQNVHHKPSEMMIYVSQIIIECWRNVIKSEN